jgi:hypothetical protein
MNLREWRQLPLDEFEAKLRDAQMTRARYDELVASIEADERLEAEMRMAGTLPAALPEGKMGDSLSYGVPRVEDGEESSS